MIQSEERTDTTYQELKDDFSVEVRPFYVEDQSSPEDDNYFFAYQVVIRNLSDSKARLLNRQWIIRDGNGVDKYINGEGVIGEQPTILPGESFEYTSFCPLSTPTGNMRGKYEMLDEFGNKFWITIPLCFLRHPQTFQ